jgi:putative SOS response-associated peptidase YedK
MDSARPIRFHSAMCSRYNLTSPPDVVRAFFGLATVEAFPPRYNIAPGQPVAIVRHGRNGAEMRLVRWGLVPSWVKDPRKLSALINARFETAAEKPAFRGALRHRRCLVPADGFYEWSGSRGRRVPWLLKPRREGPIALAGLWEHWLGADGSEVETMAILTIPANPTVAPIHDRMPAVLPREHFGSWLDCRSGSSVEAVRLIDSVPDDLLEAVEIGPEIGDVRREGPDLVRPARPRLL